MFEGFEIMAVGITAPAVADQLAGLLSESFKKTCNYIITRKKWKASFTNSGKKSISNIHFANEIERILTSTITEKALTHVARKLKSNSNGFTFKENLKKELDSLLQDIDIPVESKALFISCFQDTIIDEIKTSHPDFYSQILLQDLSHSSILIQSGIINHINEILTINQVENNLRNHTENPSIDLDFFEIDDPAFVAEFPAVLNNECVYISGNSKEEVFYCVLNELQKNKFNESVWVIKNQETWKYLSMLKGTDAVIGNILIPWFDADEIIAIPNNINIFVYSDNEFCPYKDVLHMRRRTCHTIESKLRAAGMDTANAYKLVEDTHGLYIPLKKKLLKGTYNITPAWASENLQVVLPALLCGKWTETDGDKEILEYLSEMPYDQFLDKIHPYMTGEDPLLIRYSIHGTTYCQLAAVENSWEYLDSHISAENQIWECYLDLLSEILIESDPVFEYPYEERHFARLIKNARPRWSKEIKEGMLRSLIMKAFYKKKR